MTDATYRDDDYAPGPVANAPNAPRDTPEPPARPERPEPPQPMTMPNWATRLDQLAQTVAPPPSDWPPPRADQPGPGPAPGPGSTQPSFPPSIVDPQVQQRQWRNPQRTDFQAFVPNSPKGYEHWGKPSWTEGAHDDYPDIARTSLAPAPHESYGIIRGAGGMLGQWASPAVSAPAMMAGNIAKLLGPFLDYVSGGKFTPAFNRAEGQSLAKQKFMLSQQREYFEMERERMMDLTDQAVRAQRSQVGEAKEIIDDYRFGVTDQATAEQRLRDWANKNGDSRMGAVIESGGLKRAMEWISNLEAKIDDMAAGNASLRASDRRRRVAAGGRPEGYTGRDLLEGGSEDAGGGAATRP